MNLNEEFHVNLAIKLSLKTIFVDSLVVSADNYNSTSHLTGRNYKLYGDEIRRILGSHSVKPFQELQVEMRSNGVSTTRPVIRGLDIPGSITVN